VVTLVNCQRARCGPSTWIDMDASILDREK
jgi:hypothetical protein